MATSLLEYLLDLVANDMNFDRQQRNRCRYTDFFDFLPLNSLDDAAIRPKLKSSLFLNPYFLLYLKDKIQHSDLLSRRFSREYYGNGGNVVNSNADTITGKLSGYGNDGFQACLNVQQFAPNELSVKVSDGAIVIEGKHDEHEDEYGFISRQFKRRFILPNDYDINLVASSLSSDGILTVRVPCPKKLQDTDEKIIQIQQTGPAHLSVKENHADEKGEGDKIDK